MNEEIDIHPIGIEQLAALKNLSAETFYQSFIWANTEKNLQDYIIRFFSEEKLEEEMMNPCSEFYFAMLNGIEVGYLKINFGEAQTELQDKKGLEVERIYVKKEYQGKKIGQLLFDKALQIAKEKQIAYLWLGVWEKNPGAIKFYERNGLKQFSAHPFILGDDVQTDIMMKIELKT